VLKLVRDAFTAINNTISIIPMVLIGDTVFESQTGSSQGNAGNFQFSSGEDTLENYKGILSGNGASEGSTGVLSIPGFSPALPQLILSCQSLTSTISLMRHKWRR